MSAEESDFGLEPESSDFTGTQQAMHEQVASSGIRRPVSREVVDAEQQYPPEPEGFVNPITGELVDVQALELEALLAESHAVAATIDDAAAYRQRLTDEVAARIDRTGGRKMEAVIAGDELVLETNAPTADEYKLDVLKAGLEELVQAEALEAAVVWKAIHPPRTKPPADKVDKRFVGTLAKHSNEAVRAAVAAAHDTVDQRRTLTIKPLKRKS